MTQLQGLAEQVRHMKDVTKLSFRQIAAELGIHRSKCWRQYYCGRAAGKALRPKLLEPHRSLIGQWYREHPSLKAIQVWQRLRDRNIQVGYTAVKDYTLEFRRPRAQFYHVLEFGPGEEAQVDWFFFNHPRLGKVAGFALILSYSRYFFAYFFPRYSFEFFIDGHLRAFYALNGLPQSLRYDNLKSVVVKRQPLTYNPAFLEFARFYRFEIRVCNVARGNEKGRVERAIRSVRDTFCNVATHHSNMDALNKDLQGWCAQKNSTVHRSTGKTPEELKKDEPLHALPQNPWKNCLILPTQQVSKTAFITFDTNRYSVPEYLVSQPLAPRVFCERLEIYDAKEKLVATHSRSFARAQIITNPAHRSFGRISTEAKQLRIYAVIKNLEPAVAQFLLLNEAAGENPYVTAHSIFLLLKAHARQTIISAIKEALLRKVPRLKYVLSLLAPVLQDNIHEVFPQHHELLELDYQPRSLEEYEN
jgi:transposase